MTEPSPRLRKETLDKDLDKLERVQQAAATVARGLVAPGIGLVFLALVALVAAIISAGEPRALLIVVAAAIGGYMAMNIGANDVANNVGPAVGSQALTMGGALIIAAIFESAGALIAGGDVVQTISRDIVDPQAVASPGVFVRAMLAALISSALWVNLATWIGAPVSTTHAVVGGVVGAGIAASGLAAVNWPVMAGIAASWVISPLLGGVIAALFLAFIKHFLIYADEKIEAARRWVPILIAVMAGAFATYLVMKGLHRLWKADGVLALLIGVAVGLLVWLAARPLIRAQSQGLENRNQSLRQLFHIPLIFSAALLSFAHGANDVANAVGPVAAIVHTVSGDPVAARVGLPPWVMVIGALGISLGLLLFGPKLIRMVGAQITRLNPMRAYCVSLSAAVTVIAASWLGLPVSSTHIAVGAVFGVGFFREWYTANSRRRRNYIERRLASNGPRAGGPGDGADTAEESDTSSDIIRRKLVRRAHFTTIVTAWVVTVPVSALLAALVFAVLRVV